jgi:ABC-2 type transport system ATP-binding protein
MVENLTKQFGSFTAVDGVSFDVKRGEIFGFLGANGAGKTTVIKMLSGLLTSTAGSATVAGYDINTQSERIKRTIGYMSQKFSLYNDLTVGENLHFFGGVYGLRNTDLQERIGWAVDMAGLTGKTNALTGGLPVGWKQRLALGCALLHRPQIVFLDEPTGGVDPLSRRRFWDLIHSLTEEGTTVFVTTHYLDEAEYCNTIMLIHAGKIVAGGSPRQLKTEYIRYPMLEVSASDTIEALSILQREEWVIESSVFGTLLHVSVKDENEGRRRIPELLAQRGIGVKSIERIVPSLEDVFIHLVDRMVHDNVS